MSDTFTTADQVAIPARHRPQHAIGCRLLTAEVLDRLTPDQVVDVARIETRLRFGASSAELVRWALLGAHGDYEGVWPCDYGDLAINVYAVLLAPPWLATGPMLAQIERFRARIAADGAAGFWVGDPAAGPAVADGG